MSTTTGNSSSTRCAFCGANVSNASARIRVAFAAPPEMDRGTGADVKPLKWRFLTSKGPCAKFMCAACAEKRKVNVKKDRQQPQVPASDKSWKPEDMRHVDRLPQSLQRDGAMTSRLQQAVKAEPREPSHHYPQHSRHHCVRERAQVQLDKHETHHPALRRERLHSQQHSHEEPTNDSGRRRATHTSDCQLEDSGGRRNSATSRKSITQTWPSSPVPVRAPSAVAQRRATMEGATCRPRKPSSGQSTDPPRESEKKKKRLSSTAEILGMSQSINLPPNYFEMSSSSPKRYAAAPDPLDEDRAGLHGPQTVDLSKPCENEEERHRRRSASYAHMLLRMRLHYNTVQVNGKAARPASAPPRRIRSERTPSVARRNVTSDTITRASTTFVIDLGYLRAYKDAR